MRGFSTDRRTKSNVPYTVDAGHFQYESYLSMFTHQLQDRRTLILYPLSSLIFLF